MKLYKVTMEVPVDKWRLPAKHPDKSETKIFGEIEAITRLRGYAKVVRLVLSRDKSHWYVVALSP